MLLAKCKVFIDALVYFSIDNNISVSLNIGSECLMLSERKISDLLTTHLNQTTAQFNDCICETAMTFLAMSKI